MRENFTSGSIPFRKAYLQSLIGSIEVGDTQNPIKGRNDASRERSGWNEPLWVHSFVPKWRAVPGDDENYVYAIAL